ncbi:MAG: glycosyltransferase, partial [Planctomycetes bacterium]|nr:glycosyltransferase [Planctomycetota bacterium]
MRIVLFAGQLSYSNPALYTVALTRGLVDRGHDVQVVVHGGPLADRLEEIGCEVYRFRSGFLAQRRLAQFLREFKPQISQATGGQLALATGARLARAAEVPLIHTIHAWLSQDQAERYPPEVAHFVVVNQTLREHLVNERNVRKTMIRVIPYGVEPQEIARVSHEEKIPVIGTVGRLAQGRRHDEFIR